MSLSDHRGFVEPTHVSSSKGNPVYAEEKVKETLISLQEDMENTEQEICNNQEGYEEFERGYKIACKNFRINLRVNMGEELLTQNGEDVKG